MSIYLVTREGQELGTFKTARIEKGLKTGFFRASDLGWRESSGWQGLFEIVRSARMATSPAISPFMNPDHFNPYSMPATHDLAENRGVVPLSVSKELTATRPWVRLISVVMWIGCAILLLFMGLCVYFIATEPQTNAEQVHLPLRMIGLSFGCGFVAIFLIYPALKLSRYATKITRLSESGTFADLSAALAEQQRFWKFCGILTILYVTLTLLLFVGSFFFRRVPPPATPSSPPARNT